MIEYSKSDGVCILRLDDPPLNAIGFELLEELVAAVGRANADEDVHGIIVTGTEERFSVGADVKLLEIKEMAFAMAESVMPHYFNYWQEKDSEMDWVEVEQTFNIPYSVQSNIVPLRGRIDGVVRINGKLWLFE